MNGARLLEDYQVEALVDKIVPAHSGKRVREITKRELLQRFWNAYTHVDIDESLEVKQEPTTGISFAKQVKKP